MLLEAVEVGYAVVLVGIGLAAGCWLCRTNLRTARRTREELILARESLRQAGELTNRVASDVGAHSVRVQEINRELTALPDSDAQTVVSTITRLVALNEQMEQRLADAETKLQERSKELQVFVAEARTDMLTRLPNRRAFEEEAARRFAEFTRHGTPFSVLMLDVDHFKHFNDRFGHRVGDEVLRGIAAALRQTLRAIDLVARHGGEEFIALLPGTSLQDSRQAAERCREAVERSRIRFEGQELAVTVSVGAAETVRNEQLTQLIRRADAAMYAAKEDGRNRSYWHDGRVCLPVKAPVRETPVTQPAAETPRPAPSAPRPAPAPAPAENATGVNLTRLVKPAPNECDRTIFLWQVRQRIAEWKRGGPGFSVLLLRADDHAKLVQTHGAEALDATLHMIRRLLGASLREMDIIGHYDPACFALLLPRTQLHDALIVAERARKGVLQCPVPVKNGVANVSVSAGIAELSEGDDVVRICERAEAALTAAVRNRTCYHDGQWTQTADAAAPLSAPLDIPPAAGMQPFSPVY